MDFVDQLIAYFKKPKKEIEGTAPAGTCSLCWGYQEYDGKIRKLLEDKQIDVNNHQDAYMKIQKFIVQYIEGIKLKKGEIESCPTCAGKKRKETKVMDDKKPIKRHQSLQALSRQHHFGLLFSWKIRKGFSKKIEVHRLQQYAKWFWKEEIQPHFKAEEKCVFPILGKENELVQRALKEHRRIKRLFHDTKNPLQSLNRLEEELDAHIRFEERTLFNEIQKEATPEQLQKVEAVHKDRELFPVYPDPFWE